MRILFIVLSCLLTSVVVTGQSLSWVVSLGNSADDQPGRVAVDASGNVYSVAVCTGTIDLDPGPGVFNMTGNNTGYLLKLDAAGNFVWAQPIGEQGYALPTNIAVDSSGNIYVTGEFYATVDFDPGPNTFSLTGSLTNSNIFICRLDSNGSFSWAKQIGESASYAYNYSLSLDKESNVYITGSFGQTGDFDPGPGTFNMTSLGGQSSFVEKLDSLGNFIWAKSFQCSNGAGLGVSVAVDKNQNVYTIGRFMGTADFDPGPGVISLTSNNGSEDIYISKLDAAGNFVWAKIFGSPQLDLPGQIILDTSGNLYICGFFSGSVDFDPGSTVYNLTSAGQIDAFFCKYTSAGSLVWAKRFGGQGSDIGTSMALDQSGNLYGTGGFFMTASTDVGPDYFSLGSVGGEDVFVFKQDASGSFAWMRSMGGSGDEFANSLVLDGNGNVISTGTYATTADFDPTSGTYNLASNGNHDSYIFKLTGVNVGIEQPLEKAGFSLAPNPTNGRLSIKTSGSKIGKVYVFDLSGRFLMAEFIQQKEGSLDLYSLAPGTYIISIDNQASFKVIKD
jgi:hypothetical protein